MSQRVLEDFNIKILRANHEQKQFVQLPKYNIANVCAGAEHFKIFFNKVPSQMRSLHKLFSGLKLFFNKSMHHLLRCRQHSLHNGQELGRTLELS